MPEPVGDRIDVVEWGDLRAVQDYLLGFREWAYRKRAVEALGLRRGDTVVDIGEYGFSEGTG